MQLYVNNHIIASYAQRARRPIVYYKSHNMASKRKTRNRIFL